MIWYTYLWKKKKEKLYFLRARYALSMKYIQNMDKGVIDGISKSVKGEIQLICQGETVRKTAT